MCVMSKKSKDRGDKFTGVRKVDPAKAAARDEGPRLIALVLVDQTPTIQHWQELADVALRVPGHKRQRAKGNSAAS